MGEAPEGGRIYVKAVRRRRGLLKILTNSGSCTVRDADYDDIVGSRWGGLCGSQSGFWRVSNEENLFLAFFSDFWS